MQAAGGILFLGGSVELVGFGAGVAVKSTLEAIEVFTVAPVEAVGSGSEAHTRVTLSEPDVAVSKGPGVAAAVVGDGEILVTVELGACLDGVCRTAVDVGNGRGLELELTAAEHA